VLRVVLGGGFAPATAANPRPFGMPPFATLLGDAEIAAVVTYIRSSWGHRASSVDAAEVNRQRGG
jgi:mono/diheme cytochrome c family protein